MIIPAIPPIPSVSAQQALGASQSGTAASASAGGSSSAAFQNVLGQAIDSLNGVTNNASQVSLQAAAGKATAVDATVATTEAQLGTQIAAAITSKAVTSLNTIMNMQA